MHKVFGIRHHGPGSAKSLIKALNAFEPDIVLIEGPPDADNMIKHVANSGLKPPVALLIYNPKELHQASYFPFAEFSPEWQAMKYALKESIQVRFMDLPSAYNFALDKEESEEPQQQELFLEETALITPEAEEQRLVARDPLAYIARMAGYEDSERWWEVHLESQDNPIEIFDAVTDLMGSVREQLQIPEKKREIMREAFMRKSIRKAISDKFEKIAVVCGAYHSPMLIDLKKHPTKTDNAILKGIKKVKTAATWVPWTYERISKMSGYGAGVLSPAWYKLLHSNKKDATIRWMTQLAKLLRKEDLDASSAHIIEAVRLADMLATMRNLPIPGINELKEAAVTIFGGGNEAPIELIETNLVIGNKMGKVPSEVPVIPLQQDLIKRIKSVRFGKLYESTEVTTKELDIRKSTQLAASHLLHQFNLIGLDWGKKQAIGNNKLGSFHEYWKLRWKVGFSIKIIEAGMWGNTVENAATNLVKTKARDAESLPELTALVEDTLNANLSEAIPYLVKRLQDISALTKDVAYLMEALPPLVNVWRYGNTRGTKTEAIEQVIYNIIPRIFVGLPAACVHINEEATREMSDFIMKTNRSLSILNDADFNNSWENTLLNISELSNVNGILAGNASQILFNKGTIDTDSVAEQMSYFLSVGNDPTNAANWMEGFLSGSGLLIIHNIKLWNILDNWVNSINMEVLMEILPLMRRTFSEFSSPERQKMMGLAKKGQVVETEQKGEDYNIERGVVVLPTLKILLGMN
jgi:hypothetical protein